MTETESVPSTISTPDVRVSCTPVAAPTETTTMPVIPNDKIELRIPTSVSENPNLNLGITQSPLSSAEVDKMEYRRLVSTPKCK